MKIQGMPTWTAIGRQMMMALVANYAWAADLQSTPAAPASFPTPLASSLPYDVDVTLVRTLVRTGNIMAAHAQFGVLAWKAFAALNWPADANGQPIATKTLRDTAEPRVWDSWRPADTIFLSAGQPPQPWSGKALKSMRYSWKSAWRQHTTASGNLEAFSGPLVDQNGRWVRYQMRVNREEFDYIVQNELYSQDGQVRFSQREDNNQVELPLNQGETRHGAIEIKLAWKELGANDDARRFYTRELTAELSEPPDSHGNPVPPRQFKAGLVGMHISMRTESSPEWIWATFEQIDNVRANKYPDGRATHPSFYDPTAPRLVNALPPANAIQDPDTGALKIVTDAALHPNLWVESLTTTPVQVQRREIPVQAGLNSLDSKLHEVTQAINHEVQQLLAADKSVFQYYELIDTQWPLYPNAPAAVGGAGSAPESITHKTPGDMVPVFLINTIMETYFQKGPQAAGPLEQDDRLSADAPVIDATPVIASESCVGCHYSSGIAIGFKKDLKTGLEIVDKHGVPVPVFGENNHFGKTGNASFSWMLQLEPRAKPRDIHDPHVKVME